MSIDIRANNTNNEYQHKTYSASETTNPFSVKPAPSMFSRCITAISNIATSIYYTISGKKPFTTFENPSYRKEENLFIKFKSMIQNIEIPTQEEINTFNRLTKTWDFILKESNNTCEDHQKTPMFLEPNIKDLPPDLQKLVPSMCEILAQKEKYNQSEKDLARLIAPVLQHDLPETFKEYEEQRDCDIQYIQHIIASEYDKYKQKMAKVSPIYTANKKAIDEDGALSANEKIQLHKINYLVTVLISEPQYLQQGWVFRQSGTLKHTTTLIDSIDTQKPLNLFHLEKFESKSNLAISAMKELQNNFLDKNKTEKHKLLKQLSEFETNGNIRALSDLDHLTRIYIPLYREIINNQESNQMDTNNVVQIAASRYQYTRNSLQDTSWLEPATHLMEKLISRELSIIS